MNLTQLNFESPAIILGATGTIGRAIGRALLGAGVFVYGVARHHPDRKAGDLDCNELITGDLAAPGFLEHVARRCEESRILIHSAARYCASIPPSVDDERAVVDLNFHSARRAAALFGSRMCAIGSGRILLVSSIAAWRGSRCEPYARSKKALLQFQREQCAEFARSGVTLNVLLPGPVDGPFLRRSCDSQRRAQYMREIPMGRFATAEDVAALAVFLVSRQAGYITGAAVPVSGGLLEVMR